MKTLFTFFIANIFISSNVIAEDYNDRLYNTMNNRMGVQTYEVLPADPLQQRYNNRAGTQIYETRPSQDIYIPMNNRMGIEDPLVTPNRNGTGYIPYVPVN